MNPVSVAVKQLCSYILFIVVTLYATPLQQLLKLPVLLAHYAEHREQRKDLDFVDFLFMHYIGEDGVSSDNDRDMELPFKKAGNVNICFDIHVPMTAIFPGAATFYQTRGRHLVFQQQFPEPIFEHTLLKPPIA